MTVTVLSHLSLTTLPSNTRRGIYLLLSFLFSSRFLGCCFFSNRRLAGFQFIQQRLNFRNVAADDTDTSRVLDLPGGFLEPEIKLLLAQIHQVLLQLIRCFSSQFCGFHFSDFLLAGYKTYF